jgi:hypothetical protein
MSTTPMTKAQWLAALKAEGLSVVEHGDWWNRERDDETGKVFGPVRGVVIHHTAGANSLGAVTSGVAGLPGPLCHGYLPKSGKIYTISGGRANHAGTFAANAYNAMVNESRIHPVPDAAEPVDANDSTYGIEIENRGDGDDVYPIGQYIAAVKWATAICRFHGWSADSVIGHKEGTRRKIDPKGPVEGDGQFTMEKFRVDVAIALSMPAGKWANQEEEVALNKADVDTMANTDNVYRSPDDAVSENKFWTLATYQRETYLRARETKAEVAAVKAATSDLGAHLGRVEAKIEAISVGGVDLDALAVKVADELYRRMAQ